MKMLHNIHMQPGAIAFSHNNVLQRKLGYIMQNVD